MHAPGTPLDTEALAEIGRSSDLPLNDFTDLQTGAENLQVFEQRLNRSDTQAKQIYRKATGGRTQEHSAAVCVDLDPADTVLPLRCHGKRINLEPYGRNRGFYVLYGERNSGTRLMENLLRDHLKATPVNPAFDTRPNPPGPWKHGCGVPAREGQHVVVVAKHPMAWLLSQFNRPYDRYMIESIQHRNLSFSSFLRHSFPITVNSNYGNCAKLRGESESCCAMNVSFRNPSWEDDENRHRSHRHHPPRLSHHNRYEDNEDRDLRGESPLLLAPVQQASVKVHRTTASVKVHRTLSPESCPSNGALCEVRSFRSPVEMWMLKARSYVEVSPSLSFSVNLLL